MIGFPQFGSQSPPFSLPTLDQAFALVAGAPTLLNAQSSPVGSLGAAETDLMSYVMPANTLSAANKGVLIRAWGSSAANGNSKTGKLYFGSASVVSQFTSSASGFAWRFDAWIVKVATDTQAVSAMYITSNTLQLTNSSPSQTDSAPITIKVTGQGTANNDLVQQGMFIFLIN